MAIPNYQEFMLPILKQLQTGEVLTFKQMADRILDQSALSAQDKEALLPTGKQRIVINRIGWARTYLNKARLIASPSWGSWKITERGLKILVKGSQRLTVKDLNQFPEFQEFIGSKKEEDIVQTNSFTSTPDELIESGYQEKYKELALILLEKLRGNSPDFFEKVVLDLLERMGYGQGKVTGKSGDGGVDGIIHQDTLGLEKILFQAKRFADGNLVSASMLRDFIGTLEVNGVSKGVFITTSKFPKNAEEVISKTQKRIVLIDGPKLVDYMINYDLGVTTSKTYTIKSPDLDYFLED